jgi:hypothetical protein
MPGNEAPGPVGVGGNAAETTPRGPVGVGAGEQLDYDAFKEAVLARQIRNARAGGRTYYPPVPPEELESIEGRHQMRVAGARKCKELLAAARLALAADKAANDAKAMRTSALGIGSSYRDYDYDKGLWDRYYPDYYHATQTDRDAAPGGPHGPAAAQILARYISPRKAAPGFSNHSNGTAVDFTTTVNGKMLTDKSSHSSWQDSWLHDWLTKHAVDHGFHALASEEWHWDYQ